MPITYLKNGKPIADLAAAFYKDDGSGRYDSTRAGQSKRYIIQVKNGYTGDAVYISAKMSKDPNATLVSYPKSLKKGETGTIEIFFAPPEDREKGFAGVIEWEADVV